MEEYCRQMCVCHDGDDGVHCIRYWGMSPNNHHLDLKSQLRPWSLKFLSYIWVIDMHNMREKSWKGAMTVSPGLRRRGWHWEGRAFSELPSLFSLVTWLDFFSDEMYLCIKTYAFARSSDWVLCIWLTHPKLVVHRKHRKQAWCALLLLLFSLLSTRVHKLRIWVAENTEV